jgi:hypothetical protein
VAEEGETSILRYDGQLHWQLGDADLYVDESRGPSRG